MGIPGRLGTLEYQVQLAALLALRVDSLPNQFFKSLHFDLDAVLSGREVGK
jgi:hypothetical protein